MTNSVNPAKIHAVHAEKLNNGKFRFTALLIDGTEEVIKKAGSFKRTVNVYKGCANMQAPGVGAHCTFNSKGGVHNHWCNEHPMKSIVVKEI